MNTNLCIKIFLLCCCIGVVAACSSSRVNVAETTEEDSQAVKESRPVGDFREIHMSTVADIWFYQKEGTPSLVMEGDRDEVDLIQTRCENGVLRIYSSRKGMKGKKAVRIELSAPSVEKISITGVGNLYLPDPVSLGRLELSLSGVGGMNIQNLSCDKLTATLSGVGNMNIAGQCRSASLDMSGVGHIDCRRLEGDVGGHITGVGSIKTSRRTLQNPEK